ncbi:MAG: adenylyltransferase/cytidyltransferase family protein [Acidobacteria bacterium]|nr:adenylyltransferase/cytidyltransferase family protein [Acidobacteriota bacterium]
MTGSKIVPLAELSRLCRQLRDQGKIIVLANGCFDLIHVGHVRYLEAAKAMGDALIVAVNSDAGVRQLKDAGRPLVSESDRARLVAGFECVDFVTVFSDPSVEQVLRRLRPDIHVKGTDYTPETVPEAEVVKSYGGRTAIVGDPKDHSTRSLIERVLAETET